jgi:hypothetical protein
VEEEGPRTHNRVPAFVVKPARHGTATDERL